MNERSDIKALAAKDVPAFERIFKQYQPRLVLFIKGFLHDEELSRDMAQDIFLNLWINSSRLEHVKSFSTYLFQIAKYNIYNYFDSLLVHEKYTIEQVLQMNHSCSIEENIFLKDLQVYINAAINEMPPQRQRIFRMSRYEGFSNEEIAKRLGISKRTVENHLTAALADLRKILFYFFFFEKIFF